MSVEMVSGEVARRLTNEAIASVQWTSYFHPIVLCC